jgi:outer membrane receptor protein involved in Fe transport
VLSAYPHAPGADNRTIGAFETEGTSMSGGRVASVFLCAISFGALAVGAQAQDVPAGGDVETVTVTGSRIGGSTGFEAPTPVTVMSADFLKNAAPTNLADALNQLPQFNGSTFATTGGGGNASAQSNGQNLLSLRNLGPTRTLVLFDGRRLPATNQNGSSDIDILPQNLVTHVDVVTGGASAAYGSDAVAGVVNFALDTKFEGFKGDVHTGISTYGDSPLFEASAAYGVSFLGGRARIVASGEYYLESGIGILDDNQRNWFNINSGQFPNPVKGALPAVIRVPYIRSSVGSNGGLITAGPLKGTQFLADGATAPFNYGTITGTSFQSGGDGGDPRNGISPDQRHANAFLHGEYDVTDWLTVYGEGLYAHERSRIAASIVPEVGAGGQFTIFSGNPFIPSNIQATMTADKLASISVGRYLAEFPPDVIDFQSEVMRGVIGAKGDFGLFGGSWHYDTYYEQGGSDQYGGQFNLPNLRNLYAAADAVVNPVTNQIVCRSNYYNGNTFVPGGTGLDAGCVPLNVLGTNTASKAAIDYVIGNSVKDLHLVQQVASVNLNGDLGPDFNLGAGPIDVATGFEYRREAANQTVDPDSSTFFSAAGLRGVPTSLSAGHRLGLWQFNNQQPLHGQYDIKEVYGEIGLPVLKDLPGAKSLDLNAAARYTDYSQSGGVTTWKYGANWLVVDDLRLRGTISQDIRGPNLLDLFNAQTQTNQNAIYPVSTAGKTTQVTVIASGNPNLAPEKAITKTYGFVLQPHWIDGLQVSVDYFHIAIKDAIGTLPFQNAIDQCFEGNQSICQQITVNPDGTLIVRTPEENLSTQTTAGYDFEGDYTTPVGDGALSLRLLATNLLEAYIIAPGATIRTPSLATPGAPRWKGTFSATYTTDNFTVFAQERWIAASVIDPTKIEGVDVGLNRIPAIYYTDLTFKYRMPISVLGTDQNDEFYLTINNFFNQPPPTSGGNPTTYSVPVNFAYDVLGRYFTAGVRIATN